MLAGRISTTSLAKLMHGECLQALELEPSSAVYEARSNANIELEKFMEAVQDASKAIELDSSNAKAFLRKGWVCKDVACCKRFRTC